MSKLSASTSFAALASLVFSLSLPVSANAQSPDVFTVKPYVQLGNNPKLQHQESEEILWISPDSQKAWSVQYKEDSSANWIDVKAHDLSHHPVLTGDRSAIEQYQVKLRNLTPGDRFDYQIKLADAVVFASNAVARKSADQPYKVAVFGDCGAGTTPQKDIANQCYKAKPDLLVVPGDIVYMEGTFSDYMQKFFPIFNADQVSAEGVPLLRSTLVMPVLGNHDIAYYATPVKTAVERFHDALAYFVVWDTPLNGPVTKPGAPNSVPITNGAAVVKDLVKSAPKRFPAESAYSFDYGNSHWTVLDANYYMDYTDPKLRAWIKKDIGGAHKATWKFVTFHQPGFSVDMDHASEQKMRLLSDIFQETGVDVVFCGHVHNYQKTFPLKFTPEMKNGKHVVESDGKVPGTIELDHNYNGKTVTKPKGIIYIVTGGGGAQLYQAKEKNTPQPDFLAKSESSRHSLTTFDIAGDTMSVKQLSSTGELMDEFKITKN